MVHKRTNIQPPPKMNVVRGKICCFVFVFFFSGLLRAVLSYHCIRIMFRKSLFFDFIFDVVVVVIVVGMAGKTWLVLLRKMGQSDEGKNDVAMAK